MALVDARAALLAGECSMIVLFCSRRVKHSETFEFEFNFLNLGARDPCVRYAVDRLTQNDRWSVNQNHVGVSGST